LKNPVAWKVDGVTYTIQCRDYDVSTADFSACQKTIFLKGNDHALCTVQNSNSGTYNGQFCYSNDVFVSGEAVNGDIAMFTCDYVAQAMIYLGVKCPNKVGEFTHLKLLD